MSLSTKIRVYLGDAGKISCAHVARVPPAGPNVAGFGGFFSKAAHCRDKRQEKRAVAKGIG